MLVKATSDLETNFVSIERCLEYAEVETEAEWEIQSNRPNKSWPNEGAIEFHDYSTRYRQGLPLVVKNINVQLKAGEKVRHGQDKLAEGVFHYASPTGNPKASLYE